MNSKNGAIVIRDLDGQERVFDAHSITITIGGIKVEPAAMAKWADATPGVMFPRTIDPNAPAPPKPPSTLPKAAPSTPVVTRTGTSKAGPQTARLVPCTKSQWHKHHPENELCGECDPPTGRTIPRTGGYPPWAAPAHPVYALQRPTWHSPGDYRGWRLSIHSAPAGDVLLEARKGQQRYAALFGITNKFEEDKAYDSITGQIDSIEGP